MMTEIFIKNIKSIKNCKLSLANLNLITGVNSSGKSTLLQSILLLKQLTPDKKNIMLNGNYIELGSIADIFHQFYEDNEIQLGVIINDVDKLSVSINNTERYLKHDKAPITINGNKSKLNSLLTQIKYLCAERMGAEFSYGINNYLPNLGIKGENTVSFIHENRNKPLNLKSLVHPNSNKAEGIKDSLLTNINEWMKEISPGISLDFDSNQKTRSSSMSAEYYSSSLLGNITPKNFGFGISYCLPIITMILAAKENDILLIENPEAHIHPTGQTKLGILCAIAASAGIQLIIETHSDHFFNGVRLAIKDNPLINNIIKIYYFDKELTGEQAEQSLSTIINSVELYDNGKIKNAPAGFFDEWQNSLFKLL